MARKASFAGPANREDQLRWLRVMCPEAPWDYVLRAAGYDVVLGGDLDSHGTPWNRRRRRSVMRAKPQEVLLHLFSGEQRWHCPGIVVEVEKTKGADLLAPNVFQHVLAWALKGVVGAVASVCRSFADGGPPPVRGLYRWGLPGLSGGLQAAVAGDSVLWLRFLLTYRVAQAAADAQGRVSPCPTGVEPKCQGQEAQ